MTSAQCSGGVHVFPFGGGPCACGVYTSAKEFQDLHGLEAEVSNSYPDEVARNWKAERDNFEKQVELLKKNLKIAKAVAENIQNTLIKEISILRARVEDLEARNKVPTIKGDAVFTEVEELGVISDSTTSNTR